MGKSETPPTVCRNCWNLSLHFTKTWSLVGILHNWDHGDSRCCATRGYLDLHGQTDVQDQCSSKCPWTCRDLETSSPQPQPPPDDTANACTASPRWKPLPRRHPTNLLPRAIFQESVLYGAKTAYIVKSPWMIRPSRPRNNVDQKSLKGSAALYLHHYMSPYKKVRTWY